MGVLPVLDFQVKSIIHDYEVNFIENASDILTKEIIDGDVVIMDRKVKELYPELTNNLPEFISVITIEAHERHKSYAGLIPIIDQLVTQGFRKNNRLIGIGGGITQDITAFTASIMYRGVNWIFFPTTLLAQGDSCIGSKTSINFDKYKNQVGGFYPPIKIYIDLEFLNTLTHADQQSGFGEMSHYFVVAGKDDFIDYKEKYNNAVTNKNVMAELVSKSLLIKKKYIEIDNLTKKKDRSLIMVIHLDMLLKV